MAFLFGRGKKSPSELVKSTKGAVGIMDSEEDDEKGVGKASEKVSANLSAMKFMLYGDGDHDPKPEYGEARGRDFRRRSPAGSASEYQVVRV